MADALTVQIAADSSRLRADLALVNDEIRSTGVELRNAAKEANAGNISSAALQEVAGRYQNLQDRAGALRGAVRAVADEHQTFGQKAREAFNHAREAGEQATSSVGGLISVIARIPLTPVTLATAAIGALAFAAGEAAQGAVENAHELKTWGDMLGVTA